MLHFFLLVNKQGQTRMSSYYKCGRLWGGVGPVISMVGLDGRVGGVGVCLFLCLFVRLCDAEPGAAVRLVWLHVYDRMSPSDLTPVPSILATVRASCSLILPALTLCCRCRPTPHRQGHPSY